MTGINGSASAPIAASVCGKIPAEHGWNQNAFETQAKALELQQAIKRSRDTGITSAAWSRYRLKPANPISLKQNKRLSLET